MRVLSGGIDTWDEVGEETAVTLGVFDGVHLGHRALIERAFAHRGTPTVITFDPHPVEVLVPGTSPGLITTIDERLELLEDVGAEIVAVLDLGEVRHLPPADFVDKILVGKISTSSLTVGADFHFGRNRSGDVTFLQDAGSRSGFEVEAVDLVAEADEVVSSTRIRHLITVGDVARAAELLGSRYRMTNTVVHGDKRGRDIGFPTANLEPAERKVIPANGVYATVARLDGRVYAAATNVGTRPTFGGGRRLVEPYLLDFDEEIYGRELTVEFVAHLRPELVFEDVDELVERMHVDVHETRDIVDPVIG